MIDLAGLTPFLLSLGGPGAVIVYLLWDRKVSQDAWAVERKALQDQLHECRTAHMLDIRENLSRTTAGLAMASEFIKANNAIQDRAAETTGRLATGIAGLDSTLESTNDALGRVENLLLGRHR